MKRRKRTRKAKRSLYRALSAVLALLAVLTAGVITFGQDLNWDVPNWEQVKASVGAQDKANATDLPLNVFFLDVGQGDCELIHTAESSVLIDAGENLPANSAKIISYARQLGIKQFDYVIASHPHSDHIGAMAKVLREIPAKTVIMPDLPEELTPTTRIYEELLNTILEQNIPVRRAVPGDVYETVDGLRLEILAPVETDDNLNNMSAVVKLWYGNASYLFAGDAESESEKAMQNSHADLQADVLKVGHHGSRTSSSKAFLQAVRPGIAVISCGAGNSYGHPNQQTLERLADVGSQIFRTDLQGTITIGTDGERFEVITEK